MQRFSAIPLSLAILTAAGCKRDSAADVDVKLKRSQFMIVTHPDVTDDATAIGSCDQLCSGESAYWNGYYATTNPFMDNQGGLCECIRAKDPYPDNKPVTFGLTTPMIEETYGSVSAIGDQMRHFAFALEASASAGEGGAGGSASSSAGGGRASASASTGSASASAGSASARAGAAAGGGNGVHSGTSKSTADGDGNIVDAATVSSAKSQKNGRSGMTVSASADSIEGKAESAFRAKSPGEPASVAGGPVSGSVADGNRDIKGTSVPSGRESRTGN